MKKKILIVEDNPVHMRLFEMTLGSQNYSLLKATDGQQALALAAKEVPDLILTDMNLPGITGFELTRRIRATPTLSQIPIIGITAYAMIGDRDKVLEAGCDAYLTKPINTRELPKIIADMLSQRTPRNPEGGNYG